VAGNPSHEPDPSRKRRVRLLAVGGTIASTAADTGPVEAALAAQQLVDQIPGLAQRAEIEAVDVATTGSSQMTPARMLELSVAIETAVAEGIDGVVVTHGTDTLEETAYWLALTVPRHVPVVVTGAMRPPQAPGSDGPANLVGAVLTASSVAAAPLGPVVVMGDEVHAARFVRKVHAHRVAAFASPEAGPLGQIGEGELQLWFRPTYDDYLGTPRSVDASSVLLLKLTSDPGSALLSAALDQRPAAVVVEGVGAGHVPRSVWPQLERAQREGVAVIVAAGPQAGGTLERSYASERDLTGLGVLRSGVLPGHKARLRAMAAVALSLGLCDVFPV
jgi:L-asparaginase